jgi:hypothetical protein
MAFPGYLVGDTGRVGRGLEIEWKWNGNGIVELVCAAGDMGRDVNDLKCTSPSSSRELWWMKG